MLAVSPAADPDEVILHGAGMPQCRADGVGQGAAGARDKGDVGGGQLGEAGKIGITQVEEQQGAGREDGQDLVPGARQG